MLQLTWKQAAAWRAGRHYLAQRAPAGSLLRVTSRICGLHAQVMSSAELAAWARIEGLQCGAVQRALWKDRTLVKTWAMRGTLHLLPASELPLWQAALAISPRYLRPALWQKYYGITLEDLDQITEAIGTALEGQVLTREDLVQEVGRLTGPAFAGKLALSSWGTMLKPAAFTGRLCFAPSIGPRVRFTRPDTWLAHTAKRKPAEPVDAPAATTAIARRYLAAYGPATCHDLARWWGGGGVAAARQWIASLGEEAVPVEIEGVRAWMLAADAREARDGEAARSVRLLPGFDPYVIGASFHAAHLLPGDLRARVYRPQGWISPVLLVNGRMEGVWRHAVKGSRMELTVEPFRPQPLWVRRAATREAERLAAFLGSRLDLGWKQ